MPFDYNAIYKYSRGASTLRLLKFLEEMAWKKGADNDYPGDSNLVIFFTPNEVYKKEGQVHGLLSHAIKHMHEFRPGIKSAVMSEFNRLIADVKDVYINRKPTDHRIFGFETILNTLDVINDKVENHKELLPIETAILEAIIKPMAEQYNKFAEDFIQGAVVIKPNFTEEEIRNLLYKRNATICFPCKYHSLHRVMFVNMQQGVLLTTTRDKKEICTCYKAHPEKLKRNVEKQEISYQNVKKAFK